MVKDMCSNIRVKVYGGVYVFEKEDSYVEKKSTARGERYMYVCVR